VDADKNEPYILHSKVEKDIKEISNNKATGDDNLLGDILKLLGADGLNII
jgi:hypothetical protein